MLALARALHRRQHQGLLVKALLQQCGILAGLVGGWNGVRRAQLPKDLLDRLEMVVGAALHPGLEDGVQVAKGRRAGLGGLGAGVDHVLLRQLPVLDPAPHAVQLVDSGAAVHGELLHHRRGQGIDLIVVGDGLIHVLQAADAPIRPLRRALVGSLEHRGRALAAGLMDFIFQHAQRRLLGKAQHVQPVVGHLVLVGLEHLSRREQGLQRGIELAVLVIVPIHLRLHLSAALQRPDGVGRGTVAQPFHQAHALPVGEGVEHGLLLHVQRLGYVRQLTAQLRMQAQHARIQIHAQVAVRRGGQVFQQEHILNGRDVEHRRALGKAAKRHKSPSFA